MSQHPQRMEPEAGIRPAAPATTTPAEVPDTDAGAPLPGKAGAALKPPQAVAWSRVVPLWRWFFFMVFGAPAYTLWWYYNGWRLIAAHRRTRMRPLLRTLLFPFFVVDFYRGVFDVARERGYPERPPLLPLSIAWVLFWAAPLLLGPGAALLQVVTVFLMLPAAEALNYFWASVEEGQPVYRGVSPVELALLAFGIALNALLLYAAGAGLIALPK